MADFRTKLFTLASAAVMFAGMAHGQALLNSATVACTPSAGAIFVPAEGTTEEVANLYITCTNTSGAATAAANPVTLSVFLSPAVTITSATVGTGSGAKNESLAGTGVVGGALTNSVNGTVSGSTVTFTGINVGTIANNASVTLAITNIKINASQIATGSGAPTAVQETVFISGTGVQPGALAATTVAYATNALTGVKTTPFTGNSIPSIPICTGSVAYGAKANGFNLVISEAFPNAWKTQGAAGSTILGDEFTQNFYTGYGVSAGGGTNLATSGTRIQVTFNNVPANVIVYVPRTVSNNGGTLTLVNSATGARVDTTGSTANGAPGAGAGNQPGDGTYAAVTVSNGSGTVVYEETANAAGTVETETLPIFLSAAGAAVAAPSSAITATVNLAPVGASSNVPNFVSGSSTATVNGNAFGACTTTLLFPFVTNQLGFDTGVAISNTSKDLLNGGTKSVASAQSGTCSLTFFGNTAPSAAVSTDVIAAGTSYAAAASTLAPGFQGYMIASCNFLYAHGFAYVVYNLTQNNGAAMGYLADVITSDRKSPVTSLNATFTAVNGNNQITALTYSGTTDVSATNPESWGH